MRRILSSLAIGAVLVAAAPAGAQQAATISPGMSVNDVRAVLGAPAVARQADDWTYYFYTNRCLPRCGTDDTVFFRDGRVVSAVFHSPSRRYAGPAAASALGRAGDRAGRRPAAERAVPAGGASVTGIRVRAAEPAEQPAADLGVISGAPRSTAPVASNGETAVQALAETPSEADAAATVEPHRAPSVSPRPAPPPPDAARDRGTREARIEANTIRRPSDR